MIKIRLLKDYDKSQLKFILEKIKEVAPRELTYSLEADEVEDVDVNIREKNFSTPINDYVSLSSSFQDDLWVVILQVGYIAYWRGKKYGGYALDEIIYDMFE